MEQPKRQPLTPEERGERLEQSLVKMEDDSTDIASDRGSLHSIQDLPPDVFALIVSHCPDLKSITELGSTSTPLRRMIFHQSLLNCDRCRTPLFADEDLSVRAPHTKAFSCSVCHAKLCGYQLFDYDRRNCKPQRCDGCGSLECLACMKAHTSEEHADGYGTENYCEACQGEFEFGMGGC
eukprot:CAMPEP_0168305516 /NCGR_PEP_ID=MMETSP0142_2-20121227/50491_1 /TAXON_ID=44445 /ORGANISM="Pseudo-nitzschia australis, Strain 10249 10 AB" /LENGTH=179 /DNA_ID=CAMNT_0008257021 /DNA_START=17 /DNA_END=556 /DNA_ORIENTATION=-